jgi:hypothetical protein
MTGHAVTVETRPGHQGDTLPFTFSATCTCRGLATGQNAIKWVLLAVQEHYAQAGMTAAKGNLIDGHAVLADIEGHVLAAAHHLNQISPGIEVSATADPYPLAGGTPDRYRAAIVEALAHLPHTIATGAEPDDIAARVNAARDALRKAVGDE